MSVDEDLENSFNYDNIIDNFPYSEAHKGIFLNAWKDWLHNYKSVTNMQYSNAN